MRTMLTYKCATRLQNEDDIQSALANTLTKDFLGIHFQAQNDIVLISLKPRFTAVKYI